MVTIHDIARQAGVSIGTVDRVLHERGRVSAGTRKKVLEIVERTGYQPNHVAQGLAANKKKLKLCFVVPDSAESPFFTDIKKAAQAKAAQLGGQYGVSVRFCYLRGTAQTEAALEEELRPLAEADGIAAAGLAVPALRRRLAEAARRGVPIVFFNCSLPDIAHLAFVGCDYVESGRLAAGLAALCGTEAARVCAFSRGLSGVESYDLRMEGFRQELRERYPAMRLVGEREISSLPRENARAVAQMLRETPDVNVAYIVNPMAYEICEAIAAADPQRRIRIITNDLVGGQIDMVRRGVISATICQEPEKQGARPLDILFKYLAYGTKPEQVNCYTGLSIHIAQNTG